ncbi:MAG: SDR family oxidoreductase [Planctomycetaceae bacterium]|nr:MAG: SDR family oxidoreductase [Planctomycetaceae bacterium]
MKPDEPVALITGASQGIGATTARVLAERGYHCALLAPDREGLETTAAAVRQQGREALVCAGDLCDLEYASASVAACLQRFQRIDVLINNAAWRDVVTMRRISLESWEKTLRVCLTAPAFLARHCAEAMETAGGGVILNVSSIQSKFAAGISPAYVAAKGGLDALTYELATLYGPQGIRVLAVNPGAVDTALSHDYVDANGDNLASSLRTEFEDMIPLRRYATSLEIARCIAMLVSPDASYLTGTCIELDGGWFHQASPYRLKRQQFPDDFPQTRPATQMK